MQVERAGAGGLPVPEVHPSAAAVRAPAATPAAPEPVAPDAGTPDALQVRLLVDQLNQSARYLRTNLLFHVEDGHLLMVAVVDASTGEVIKSVPPDRLRDAVSKMQALVGLLMDLKI